MTLSLQAVLQLIGAVTGVAGIWYNTQGKRIGWILDLASIVVYAIIYWEASMWGQVGLHVYFAGMAVYGLVYWGRDRPMSEFPIVTLKGLGWAIGALALAVLTVVFYYILVMMKSASPLGDAFVVSGSIVAQWLMARRYLENWLVWTLVNGVAIVLYYQTGINITAGLYVIYLLMGVRGWLYWREVVNEKSTGVSNK